MLEWNLEFAGLLERAILARLHGEGHDNRIGGLFRGLMSCQTMSDYERSKGVIQGYEEVLSLMREIARKMNDHDERPEMRVRAN